MAEQNEVIERMRKIVESRSDDKSKTLRPSSPENAPPEDEDTDKPSDHPESVLRRVDSMLRRLTPPSASASLSLRRYLPAEITATVRSGDVQGLQAIFSPGNHDEEGADDSSESVYSAAVNLALVAGCDHTGLDCQLSDRMAVLEHCISLGASVEGGSECAGGVTPLMMVAAGGWMAGCKLLLTSGADHSAIDCTSGRTPLHFAALGTVFCLLCIACFSHSLSRHVLICPLKIPADSGPLVDLFLRRGVPAEAVDSSGFTAADLAAARGCDAATAALTSPEAVFWNCAAQGNHHYRGRRWNQARTAYANAVTAAVSSVL